MTSCMGIYNEESARAVQGFFKGMQLPVPGYGEYRDRSLSMGGVVLVSEYGFVIRTVPDEKVLTIENPHFIRPLFNRVAGNHRVVIDPGYELNGVTQEACNDLGRIIRRKYSLHVGDLYPKNIARLPARKFEHMVVIDLDPNYIVDLNEAASTLTCSAKAVKRLIKSKPEESPEDEVDPQIEQYAPLRDLLGEVWPEGKDTPDPDGIRRFKERCLEFKEAGLLLASWTDPHHDYEGTTKMAMRYAQRVDRMKQDLAA